MKKETKKTTKKVEEEIKEKELLEKEPLKNRIKNFMVSFKNWSKKYVSTNVLFMTFVITSLINAYLLRYFTVKNYFNIKPIIADLSVILIVGSIGYLLKPKHQFKYFFSWAIVFTLICVINSVYFTNFLSFASFSLLKASTQVIGVSDAVTKNIMEIKDFFYVYQILAMIFVHKFLKKKKYYDRVSKIENGKVRAINTLVVGVIFLGMFISLLTSRDISRLGKQWNRESIVMEFGIYTYQLNDLNSTVKASLNPLFGYDKSAKEFREFYDNREEEKSNNKYTNMFKGKNVLVIHAESIQNFALDVEFNGVPVAPNLKKLSKEGLYFSNFYSEESVGTSSDTEFTFASSLMPSSSGTVFMNYFNRDYPTIQKKLKEKDYYTFSMHGNNCSFWNRQTMHKSLGYDDFYCHKKDYDIDETIGLGLSDKSFFRQSVPILEKINKEHKNWYGTLIMLTNHTPFTDIDEVSDYKVTKTVEIENDNGEKETVERKYMEGTVLGSYFKSVHYADEALGQLLADMDEKGLLDNTIVVIYGDHDNKIKKSEYNRFYNYDAETDSMIKKNDERYTNVDYYFYELNRKVPFIIWSKNKKLETEVTKVMGMIDVQPTLGNMLGFSNEYALGHDIFNIDENVVVFPSGNWLTDKMYYSQSKSAGKILNSDETVAEDYIKNNNKYSEKIIKISNDVIIYDMIKKQRESQNTIKEAK